MMALHKDNSFAGELLINEPLARYTTWRVGGPAEQLYRPANIDDLVMFIRQLPEGEDIFWLGLGSNLLVRDGGISGTVIATQGALNEIGNLDNGCVRVEAGVSCARVARFCRDHSLTGVEFLAGIPGTMGGALAMNAGAFGGETWRHVESVETIDHTGRLTERKASEYKIGYRSVRGPENEWFVAAHLRLDSSKREKQDEIRQNIKALLEERGSRQPIGLPSCGSVFRNPEGYYAAELIEQSGLKGLCEGGACVSEKHANFIVNTGNATASDIESLINRVVNTVIEKQGVRLEKEVCIVGEPHLPGGDEQE